MNLWFDLAVVIVLCWLLPKLIAHLPNPKVQRGLNIAVIVVAVVLALLMADWFRPFWRRL